MNFALAPYATLEEAKRCINLNYVDFNQNFTCISVASRTGFRIYTCHPFACEHVAALGGLGIAEMLNNTSVVVIAGGGPHPALSSRALQVWNTRTGASLAHAELSSPILRILLNRQRLVAVLSKSANVYDLDTMEPLAVLETPPNPRGIAALAPSDKNILVLPSSPTSGDLIVYNALTLAVLNVIKAHSSPVAALAISHCGTRIATASEKGTLVRVFGLPSGDRLHSFRRGSTPTVITHLSFYTPLTPSGSPTPTPAAVPAPAFLCAASTSLTVHVFKLQVARRSGPAAVGSPAAPARGEDEWTDLPDDVDGPSEDGMKPVSSKVVEAVMSGAMKLGNVEGERDFAHAKLKTNGVPGLCAITSEVEGARTLHFITVITSLGGVHQYKFDPRIGGECKLDREFTVREDVSEDSTGSEGPIAASASSRSVA